MRSTGLAALSVVTLLAACGGDDDAKPDVGTPEGRVQAFAGAVDDKDWEGACDHVGKLALSTYAAGANRFDDISAFLDDRGAVTDCPGLFEATGDKLAERAAGAKPGKVVSKTVGGQKLSIVATDKGSFWVGPDSDPVTIICIPPGCGDSFEGVGG